MSFSRRVVVYINDKCHPAGCRSRPVGAFLFSDNAISTHFSFVWEFPPRDFTSREGYRTKMLCPWQSLADNIFKKKLEESFKVFWHGALHRDLIICNLSKVTLRVLLLNSQVTLFFNKKTLTRPRLFNQALHLKKHWKSLVVNTKVNV